MKRGIRSKTLAVGLSPLLMSALVALALVLSQSMAASAEDPPPPADATGYEEVILTDDDEGDQVILGAGRVLVISLAANYSTGYRWHVVEVDGTVLREGGGEYIQDEAEPGMVGVPGRQILRFSASRAGQTPLRLEYRRSWEKVPPLDTFSIQVQAEGPGPRLEPEKPAVPPTPAPVDERAPRELSALPSSWDWCDEGGCTPVKDQGACGSCWAFATVGVFESRIKIRDGVERDLSEQYLVSCNDDGWGCDGGRRAHKYHYDTYIAGELGPGARYEADFPYSASDEPCNPPHPAHERLCYWSWVPDSVDAIKEAIYYAGPVMAHVCAGGAFHDYPFHDWPTHLVFDEDESGECDDDLINHAIVLVGWIDDLLDPGRPEEPPTDVWILRNSWGSDWGFDGYMFIKHGVSNVGMGAYYVVYEGEPPSTSHTISGTPGEFGWYVSDVWVTLSAQDNPYGSDISLTQYQVDGGAWQTYSSPFLIQDGRHSVSYRSQDGCGNWESSESITLNVDTVPPSGLITLNRASPTTFAATVRARVPASDATSGVYRMRLRDAGGSWTDWQAHDPNIFWQLPDPETGQTYAVEVQFKDWAGNITGYTDAITLDIHPVRPASASYRLAISTWGASGSPASSTSYRLQNTLGQPSMVGWLLNASYLLWSGFWGQAVSAGPPYMPGHVYLPMIVAER